MNSPLRVATFSRVSGGAGVLPVLVHVLVHVLYLADSDVAYEFGEDERITGAGNAFLGHLFSSGRKSSSAIAGNGGRGLGGRGCATEPADGGLRFRLLSHFSPLIEK